MIKELYNNLDAIETKIAKKKKQIERAEKSLKRMESKTSWVSALLIPIAKAIMEKEGFFKFQTMGPFGLTCETSIWFWKTEEDYLSYKNSDENWTKRLISITFRPHSKHDENGVYQMRLVVVTEEEVDKYPEGSIGKRNGFGKREINISDWDLNKLIKFMKKQNKGR